MIRYLIMLECVLLALLATQWVLDRPQESRMAHLSPPPSVVDGSEAAPLETTRQPVADAVGAPSAFSTADRSSLARDLLGLTGERSSTGSGQRDELGSAAASVADADAAREPDAAVPAGRTAQPGLETRDRPDATVAAAQRLLARLGYDSGPIDGLMGERTERAVREYRRRTGSGSVEDGEISEALLAQLRRDAGRLVAQAKPRRQPARSAERSAPAANSSPGWIETVAGGFQRLLGQEFDSIRQPGRLRAYCRANQDTWIFDEGRRAFLYCGTVAAAR